jgi:hypothetical protein
VPLSVVIVILAFGIWSYAGATAPATLPWRSAREYMRQSGSFERAGFRIECDFGGNDPACTMLWTPPHDRRAQTVTVYKCDDESGVSRETILKKFAQDARRVAVEATVSHALAVLNAFFQSGLRREIDRSVRRARDHSQFANRMPPFELRQDAKRQQIWIVAGVDEAQQAIPTGLPRRPEYSAPVYGRWQHAQATLQVTVRSLGATASASLDPRVSRPCHPIWPGAAQVSDDCNSVSVLACESCAPVVSVRTLSAGTALVMRAADANGVLLSRALQDLNTDDIIVSDADSAHVTTLFVRTAANAPPLAIDITHEAGPPLSRVQMVNGRWMRWYEPGVEPWLSPVAGRMEQFASQGLIDGSTPMTMSLDIGLQHELEDALQQWMAGHAEGLVAADIARHGGRSLREPYRGERNHRRAVPEAGITVVDPQTGEILATASYPPPSALRYVEGVPMIAPAWKRRLAGATNDAAMVRQVASELANRVEEDANSNFARHPIGSTVKPLLLSAVIDDHPRGGASDGLDRFFDLVVGGHLQYGKGHQQGPPRCPECLDPSSQPIAGLPLGPWGDEEAGSAHANDPWIDRRDFILDSCNKYAVTFGVLTMLDWSAHPPNGRACCWLAGRDHFGFSPTVGGGAPQHVYSSPAELPPVGPWLDPNTLEALPDSTANAPIFHRLAVYYGIHAGSNQQAYDSDPWRACVRVSGLDTTTDPEMFVGRVATTELALTSNRITTAFTNIFTGSGRNWWTNVKLAEAYARLIMNRGVTASFCPGAAVPQQPLFGADARQQDRWKELMTILSAQRMHASWVRPNAKAITAWVEAGGGKRMTASKTGTSLRGQGFSSTGIFAIYAGGVAGTYNGQPVPDGRGVVIVAHVDDIGHSSQAVALVNDIFKHIEGRLP